MPRYYFHIKDGVRLVNDDKGKDFRDIAEAKAEAARLAVEVRAEFATANRLINELKVEITNEGGTVLGSVPLVNPHFFNGAGGRPSLRR